MARAVRIAAVVLLVLAAGCAGPQRPSPAMADGPPLIVEEAPSLGESQIEPVVEAPAPPPAPPKIQIAIPAPRPAPKPQARPVAAPPLPPPAVALPPIAKKAEAPLDVALLKSRLRETAAIGTLTKLSLRNQMDELIQRFRTHHEEKMSIAALRQPFDTLIFRVLSLLQDDPALAQTISESREAIWDILADPVKLAAES